jgi:hypothetical protein
MNNFGFWILDFGLQPSARPIGVLSGRYGQRIAAHFHFPERPCFSCISIQNPKSKIQNS